MLIHIIWMIPIAYVSYHIGHHSGCHDKYNEIFELFHEYGIIIEFKKPRKWW
jgi:hypothetical protein